MQSEPPHYMDHNMKIGIIQNAPLTADFPNNLRSIVQGYRDCLDHGAELVIAPATALCGLRPRDLATRRSFLKQTQSALDALSQELGSAPLLLGACTALFSDDPDDWDSLINSSTSAEDGDEQAENTCVDLVPFLLEKDTVTELPDAGVTEINGLGVYVDISIGEIMPDDADFDLLVHLGDDSWHTGAAPREESTRRWEARSNNVPVASVQAVGTADGHLYAGGSAIYNAEGKPLLRLPFFEPGNRVVDTGAAPHARALPQADELLEQALIRGIRDTAHQNGYNAVCLPLEHPNAALLASLCVGALGSANVYGITFNSNEHSAHIAQSLGISVQKLDSAALIQAAGAEPHSPLALRLQAALICNLADEKGYMLLSPLDRHDIMLGQFTLYGESCGQLAPLGNLYRMDVHLLSLRVEEQHPGLLGTLAEPAHPEQDRIIHELADRNIAASELLANNAILFPENDVRYVQRRMIASATKRAQLPTILHVDAPAEQLDLPLCHRLND